MNNLKNYKELEIDNSKFNFLDEKEEYYDYNEYTNEEIDEDIEDEDDDEEPLINFFILNNFSKDLALNKIKNKFTNLDAIHIKSKYNESDGEFHPNKLINKAINIFDEEKIEFFKNKENNKSKWIENDFIQNYLYIYEVNNGEFKYNKDKIKDFNINKHIKLLNNFIFQENNNENNQNNNLQDNYNINLDTIRNNDFKEETLFTDLINDYNTILSYFDYHNEDYFYYEDGKIINDPYYIIDHLDEFFQEDKVNPLKKYFHYEDLKQIISENDQNPYTNNSFIKVFKHIFYCFLHFSSLLILINKMKNNQNNENLSLNIYGKFINLFSNTNAIYYKCYANYLYIITEKKLDPRIGIRYFLRKFLDNSVKIEFYRNNDEILKFHNNNNEIIQISSNEKLFI